MTTWKKLRKKLVLGALAIGMTVTLTGCDMPNDLKQNISNAFRDRSEANIAVATDLHNSGIISDDTFKRLTDSITQNLEDFGKSVTDVNNKAAQNLLKSCVAWRVVPKPEYDDDGKLTGYTLGDKDWNSQFLTNFCLDYESESGYKNNVPVLTGNSKKIKAIEVISESLVDQLNEELSIPVYVLKSDLTEANGVDGIIEAVKQASDNKSESGLANYFEAAYYKNDKNEDVRLTLMDPTNKDEQLIRVTSGASSANNDSDSFTVNNPLNVSNTSFSEKTGVGTGYKNTSTYGFPNSKDVGSDMLIEMGGETIMAVRLIEFNKEAVDLLRSKIGLSDKRYLVINNKAYLMEYPVGYIDGFKESEDRNSYTSVIKESQIGFNLLTGKFSKFEVGSDGTIINNSSVITNGEDPYITYNGAKSNADETMASLVLYGSTGVSKEGIEEDECNPAWNLVLGTYVPEGSTQAKDRIVNTGRIVLRDYLEATYAPGVVGSDKLIVLGRKLRILKMEGSKSDIVARFYDKDGNMLGDDSAKLFIDDFADVNKLTSSSPKVGYISRIKEELDESVTNPDADPDSGPDPTPDQSDPDDASDNLEDAIKNSVSKIDKLDKLILDKITCSTKFPGPNIGASDYSAVDEKPLFYAMAVKASMFQTGLFSGWVQSTDQEKNSTAWWNIWLGKHGFTYSINTDNLVNYLKGNYAYDLNKAGVVILDLETIAKIQQEYTEQHQTDTARGLRTVFIVVGYILIAYAVILMIAWNVDVNVDLGFNILEKISFGKWVAVKDYEELPYMNTEETNFIRFGPLVVSCIGIIALGIVLITVNIIDVILMLIQLFGGIAEYITRIITGVK